MNALKGSALLTVLFLTVIVLLTAESWLRGELLMNSYGKAALERSEVEYALRTGSNKPCQLENEELRTASGLRVRTRKTANCRVKLSYATIWKTASTRYPFPLWHKLSTLASKRPCLRMGRKAVMESCILNSVLVSESLFTPQSIEANKMTVTAEGNELIRIVSLGNVSIESLIAPTAEDTVVEIIALGDITVGVIDGRPSRGQLLLYSLRGAVDVRQVGTNTAWCSNSTRSQFAVTAFSPKQILFAGGLVSSKDCAYFFSDDVWRMEYRLGDAFE